MTNSLRWAIEAATGVGVYVTKSVLKRSADLEQGDILADFVLPDLAGANAIFRRQPESLTSQPIPLGTQLSGEHMGALEVSTPVRRTTVLVVSNTCDMSGGGAVTVVPVGPLSVDAGSAEKQWKEIQRRATSGTWAKSFYLGPLARVGLPRSEAMLPALTTFAPAYVQRLIDEGGARRLVSLNADGVSHLRWALGYFFGRNAREENDWHSDDDLQLREKALEAVPTAKRDDGWSATMALVRSEIAKRGLSTQRPPVADAG